MTSNATGYPGCEFQIRGELAKVVGKEKSEFFFDKVRTNPLPAVELQLMRLFSVPRILLPRRRCRLL